MSTTAPQFTHEMYSGADVKNHKRRQRVQVLYQGVPQCAHIVKPWVNREGKPMWKVNLIGEVSGEMSFPVPLVRQCGGLDGRCHCEPQERKPS